MLKQVLTYTLPSIFTSLFTGLYVIVDGYFVGYCIGELGLAALNVAWPVTALIQTFGISIGTAGGIYLSIAKGQGKREAEKQIVSSTFQLLIAASLLCMLMIPFLRQILFLFGASDVTISLAMDYTLVVLSGAFLEVVGCGVIPLLRNEGYIKVAATALMVATVGNIIGDSLFISVWNMGMKGIALSSFLAQALAGIICILTLVKTGHFSLNLEVHFHQIKKILTSAIAPFILIYGASFLLIINNLACYQAGKDEAIAAYTVLAYVLYIAQYGAAGIADGIQPLFSLYYGKQELKSLNSCFKIGSVMMIGLMGFFAIFFQLLDKQVCTLFSLSGDTLQIALSGYLYFSLGYVFLGMIRFISCYFYATNQDKTANMLVVLEPFVITPVLLIVLPVYFGMQGVWMTYLIAQVLICAIATIMIYFKKKKGCEWDDLG